jgi:hypothetical protein
VFELNREYLGEELLTDRKKLVFSSFTKTTRFLIGWQLFCGFVILAQPKKHLETQWKIQHAIRVPRLLGISQSLSVLSFKGTVA